MNTIAEIETRPMRTTDLHVGNVIVADDGTEHTVTALQLTHATVKYVTDTGLAMSMNWVDAHKTILNVRV